MYRSAEIMLGRAIQEGTSCATCPRRMEQALNFFLRNYLAINSEDVLKVE